MQTVLFGGVPKNMVSRAINGTRATATRGLLATDHVILNHDQVTWMTPELAPPLLTTTPHQREELFSYTRAFSDIPRNFEVPRTTPELASPSPNYHITPTGGRLSSRQI
ncbi:uncharacterized protein TNCV_937701 [Trichonephila clavipes]|nr:uncharacterized protein TNCV_937701 [Trichonephila clavipes]